MTRIFAEDSRVIPCTVIEAGPCIVTQLRTSETDGYTAVQMAYGDKREKNTTRAVLNHLKKANCGPKRKIAEFRYESIADFEGKEVPTLGQTVIVTDVFSEGECLDASAVSKGKGFSGVVKRHGFSGVGSRTHGQHNRERAAGSVGASSFPSRVFPGMRMAGRHGGKKVTVGNIVVAKIFPEKNLILVKGAVPGVNGSYVILKK